MIKHSEVLALINSGSPFSCTYVTGQGELSEFINATKKTFEKSTPADGTDADKSKRRKGNSYNSLIPVETANGEIREIYTRAIIKFNNVEVVL